MRSPKPLVLGTVVVVVLASGVLLARASGALMGGDADPKPLNERAVLANADGAQATQGSSSTGEPPTEPKARPRLALSLPPPPSQAEVDQAQAERARLAAKRALPEAAKPSSQVPAGAKTQARTVSAQPGCGGPCSPPSRTTTGALRTRALNARGCYQSGLQNDSYLEGRIVVHVRIGSAGQACFAKTTSDTLSNPAVTSCILERFRALAYPKPASGCVEAQVPISFAAK